MAGARWVRKEILDRHPEATLRVFVVWFEMLPTDSRRLVDLRALGDARVSNFWDRDRLAGRWFARNATKPMEGRTGKEAITWDVYYLYGPEARWHTVHAAPEPLVATGNSVIGASGELIERITPLLDSQSQPPR